MNHVYILLQYKSKYQMAEVVHVDYNRDRALDKFDYYILNNPLSMFEIVKKEIHE